MLNKRIVVNVIIFTLLLLLPGFLFAQTTGAKPRITVFPLENPEKDLQVEVISKNVQRTVELNLKMMDQYIVVDNTVSEYSGDNNWLLDYSVKNNIDNIIFGKAEINKTGSVILQMSVFNRESKSTTLTKTENAETLFDIFRASDLLAIGMIEGFSGMSLGFGEIKFTNSGEKGNYNVYIDNVFAGENLASLPAIITGSKTVKITQERMFGTYVAYDKKETIEEKKVTEIVFSIPGFLEKEGAAIGKEEKNIDKNWDDKYSSKSVDKSFAKLFEILKIEGYSESEETKKKEVDEKYLAWGKQKEEWGIEKGLGILDKRFGVSLFFGPVMPFTHYEDDSGFSENLNFVSGGMKFGASFSVNLPYNFALQTEIAYFLTPGDDSIKFVEKDNLPGFWSDPFGYRVEMELLEIPILIMYRLPGKYVSIYAGGVVQIKIGGSDYAFYHGPSDVRVEDPDSPIYSSAFGLTAGIKAEIPIFKSTFLEFDLRYSKDLTNGWLDTGGKNLAIDFLSLAIGYGIKF